MPQHRRHRLLQAFRPTLETSLTPQARPLPRQRLWLPNTHAGTIIGKGGTHIKMIREESGCKVVIGEGERDEAPMLFIGEASLLELNGRMDGEVPMERFRPNVVVATDEPHEEDRWRELSVGDLPMRVVKPCSRCVMTRSFSTICSRRASSSRSLSAMRTCSWLS